MHIGVFLIHIAFYPSDLLLCLSVDHVCLVPINNVVVFYSMGCDGRLVSNTTLPCSGGSGLCTSCERLHFFFVLLDPQTKLPACLLNIRAAAALARDTVDQFGLLLIFDPLDEPQCSVAFGDDS